MPLMSHDAMLRVLALQRSTTSKQVPRAPAAKNLSLGRTGRHNTPSLLNSYRHHTNGKLRLEIKRQQQARKVACQSATDSGVAGVTDTSGGICNDTYVVPEHLVEAFHRDGYVHLPAVLSEEELATTLEEPHYAAFMRGDVLPEGKDLCDMSGAVGRTRDEFTVYNAMLPRRYKPDMQGSLFERRAASIAEQLYKGKKFAIDYDQILAKRPRSGDSIFAWHQDMAYWPPFKSDPATATVWLALDNSTKENGCMRFIPGSHKSGELRSHAPVRLAAAGRGDEESSHALFTDVDDEKEHVVYAEIKRGDVTVHNELVVHGSGPNNSDGWRRAYVLAFRTEKCVAEERSHGFTHSHNDTFNWDSFHKWQDQQ